MGFEELNLHPDILKAVKRSGFLEPTPIQKRCIPEIKAGRDVVGQSLTGSGKTAAFGIPVLEKIHGGRGIQALILTPTRELALQVRATLASLSPSMSIHITAVYGGVSIQPQIDALKVADIVVATPGRMLDHIERNTVYLNKVAFLVIDEADKMFDMGFIDAIKEIIGYLPVNRQSLLFCATMSADIYHLVRKHLKNPCIIKEQLHVDKSLLRQIYYDVNQQEKFSILVYLLKNKTPGLAIVFCGTRRAVDIITRNLRMQGIHAMAVHGGLSQNKRTRAVDSIKNEDIQVLVATDVAARGIHINNVSHIYNYDSPKTSSEYTHRIGRTARAGKYGEAVTLLSERDYDNFRNVVHDRNLHIQKEHLPHFEKVPLMLKMQKDWRHPQRGRSGSHGHQPHGSGFHRVNPVPRRRFKPRFKRNFS